MAMEFSPCRPTPALISIIPPPEPSPVFSTIAPLLAVSLGPDDRIISPDLEAVASPELI
jgi:hypothetical protein